MRSVHRFNSFLARVMADYFIACPFKEPGFIQGGYRFIFNQENGVFPFLHDFFLSRE